MTWRIETLDGQRWAEATGSRWSADPQTEEAVREAQGRPVPVATMAENYTATSDRDPLWVYLAARHAMPGPFEVTGRPPAMPEPPAETYPVNAVH